MLDVTNPPYNAVGDGITDDTVAIQSAIDDAAADGGGHVYIPPNTYIVSGSPVCLLLRTNVRLTGSGPGSVIMRAPAQPEFSRILGSPFSEGVSHASVKNVTLHGSRQQQASSEHHACIFLNNASDVIVQGVHMIESSGDGIEIFEDCAWITVADSKITACGRNGITFDGSGTRHIIVQSCEMSDIGAQAIDSEPTTVGSVDNVTVSNCVIDHHGGNYAVTTGCQSAETLNNRWRIRDCQINGSIQVIRSKDLVIEGCAVTSRGHRAAVVIEREVHGATVRSCRVCGHENDEMGAVFIQPVDGEVPKEILIADTVIERHGGPGALAVRGIQGLDVWGCSIHGGERYGVHWQPTIDSSDVRIVACAISGIPAPVIAFRYGPVLVERAAISGCTVNAALDVRWPIRMDQRDLAYTG